MRENHNNKCKQTKKRKIMNLYMNNKKLSQSFCKLKMEKFERNNMKRLLKKHYIKLKCGEPSIIS